MRDYQRFDRHLNAVLQDIYAQPADAGHTEWGEHVVRTICNIPHGMKTVLDVGCGQGFLSSVFTEIGLKWTGVTVGEDYSICKRRGLNVVNSDMTFLPFEDKSYDMVFARHVLEHSPFPVLTLMEWKRVCSGYLVLVAPAPDYWGVRGQNHYSVLWYEQLEWLLLRAGWRPIHNYSMTTSSESFMAHVVYDITKPEIDVEYRVLCEPSRPEVQ